MPENTAETSFISTLERRGLLQNLTSKGGSLLES